LRHRHAIGAAIRTERLSALCPLAYREGRKGRKKEGEEEKQGAQRQGGQGKKIALPDAYFDETGHRGRCACARTAGLRSATIVVHPQIEIGFVLQKDNWLRSGKKTCRYYVTFIPAARLSSLVFPG